MLNFNCLLGGIGKHESFKSFCSLERADSSPAVSIRINNLLKNQKMRVNSSKCLSIQASNGGSPVDLKKKYFKTLKFNYDK